MNQDSRRTGLLAPTPLNIQEMTKKGEILFPGSSCYKESFTSYLRTHCAVAIAGDLHSVYLQDLYLSYAAVQQNSLALAEVQKRIVSAVRTIHASVEYDLQQEIQQQVYVRILVPSELGGKLRLLQYKGLAKLTSWLRVIAVREWQASIRKRKEETDEELTYLPDTHCGLVDWIENQEYKEAFKSAFQECFSALSIHDRTILRQHYKDRIKISKMAIIQGVHRATIARELAQIRQGLQQAVSRKVWHQLRINPAEQQELQAALLSQLEVSISRMFEAIADS